MPKMSFFKSIFVQTSTRKTKWIDECIAGRVSKFRHLKVTPAHKSQQIENVRNVSRQIPGECDGFHGEFYGFTFYFSCFIFFYSKHSIFKLNELIIVFVYAFKISAIFISNISPFTKSKAFFRSKRTSTIISSFFFSISNSVDSNWKYLQIYSKKIINNVIQDVSGTFLIF